MTRKELYSVKSIALILVALVQPLSAINTSIGSVVPSEMDQLREGGVWEGAVHLSPRLFLSTNGGIINDDAIASIKLGRPYFTTETDQQYFDLNTFPNEPWHSNHINRFIENSPDVACENLLVNIRPNRWKANAPTLWAQNALPIPDRLAIDDPNTEIDETRPGVCIDPKYLSSTHTSDPYDIHHYFTDLPITTNWAPEIQETNMLWRDSININAGVTFSIPAEVWLTKGGRKTVATGALGKPEDFAFHHLSLVDFQSQIKEMFHAQDDGIHAVYFKLTGREGHTKENVMDAARNMVFSQGLEVDQFIVCNDEADKLYSGDFAADFNQVAGFLQKMPGSYQIPRIEAENYSARSANRIEDNIQMIEIYGMGFIVHGDWLRYDNVDFGSGVNQFKVRYGSAGSGGNLRIRTGGPDGPVHASVYLPPTGDWLTPEERTTTITGLEGIQTIWITFDGPIPYVLFALDRFEFELMATDISGNLALGKPATQSDEANKGNAQLAVDGNTEGDAYLGSVATASVIEDENPWWEVDLGATYPIGEIRIWNRTDCCTDLLSGYTIIILDRNNNIRWYKHRADPAGRPTSIITGGIHGSKVRLQLNAPKPLNLAEVEIFSEVPSLPLNISSSPNQNQLPRLEAEDFDASSDNFRIYGYTETAENGYYRLITPKLSYRIYNIYDSNWIRFDNVDFGDGVHKMWVRHVTRYVDRGGGYLRLRTKSETGPIHSTVFLPRTEDRTIISDVSAEVIGLKGVNTIWVTFEGREVPLFELDWIEFDH
ncbi:MAG: carbohydrate-binding protein [Opitutales bacterium]|nr:carbohydrate-binding protein [Opitutales bacterium]